MAKDRKGARVLDCATPAYLGLKSVPHANIDRMAGQPAIKFKIHQWTLAGKFHPICHRVAVAHGKVGGAEIVGYARA